MAKRALLVLLWLYSYDHDFEDIKANFSRKKIFFKINMNFFDFFNRSMSVFNVIDSGYDQFLSAISQVVYTDPCRSLV